MCRRCGCAARDPCARIGARAPCCARSVRCRFFANLKGASVAWRARCGRLCVIRAIHHTMDISQSRRLISLYKEFKCLWDPKDVNYTNRGVRDDAWRQISREMENKPIEDLKKKMRSLAGGYRREKYREKQSRITGSGKKTKLFMLK